MHVMIVNNNYMRSISEGERLRFVIYMFSE